MTRLLVLVAALAVASAACSTAPSPAEQYCDDLQMLIVALTSVAALDGASGVGEVRDGDDAVSDAYDEVLRSAEGVPTAILDEINNARQNFRDAVDAVGDGGAVGESIVAVRATAEEYLKAVRSTLTKVTCRAPAA